jgi:two-component system NtrC family sensor kinase
MSARFFPSNIRFKLVVSLLSIVVVMGSLSLIIGINIINKNLVREATESVRNSLAATTELYDEEVVKRSRIVEYLSKTSEIVRATTGEDRKFLFAKLAQIKTEFAFDIVNVVKADGTILVRANNFDAWGDSVAHYRYIQWVLRNRKPAAGTGILGYENIRNEGKDLADRTIIKVVPTPLARQRDSQVEDRALVLKVAAPIIEDGRMVGILYAAVLLNNNDRFIDRFRRLLFKEERIDGREVGASTIFLDDIRVTTTITDRSNQRAIGTQVSDEVYRKVYEEGQTWVGQAFVVDSWYISGYAPLRDIDGRALGMLYVGVLKDKFDAALRTTTVLFLLVIGLTMLIALFLSVYLIGVYMKPVQRIIAATQDITVGNYHRIDVRPRDDADSRKIGAAFNTMAAAIEERDRKLQEMTERTILKSEKLASIGRLASGIAHEINNPLTGVLTYSCLLLEDLQGTAYAEDLEVIRDETLRCRKIVRGILDFARENEPEKTSADINAVLDGTLEILEKNVHFQNIEIVRRYDPALPAVPVDVHQFKQVISNLAVNAADAMPNGGRLTLATTFDREAGQIVIRVADTGAGIAPEHMARLFEPFFTTKEKGKGTGLGLPVVYGIIRRHNGTIDVRSTVGAGTEITIKLPAV